MDTWLYSKVKLINYNRNLSFFAPKINFIKTCENKKNRSFVAPSRLHHCILYDYVCPQPIN